MRFKKEFKNKHIKMENGNNTQKQPKENRMGYAPVNKLLLSISVPMMISMLIQALYNIIDSAFVGRISETDDALTALGYAFPIQNLMIAFSVGMGIGMNALLGKALGAKKFDKVSKIAGNTIYVYAFFTLCFMIFGAFLSKPYLRTLTENPLILEYGDTYLFYNCIFAVTIFAQIYFVRLLIATGLTKYSMVCQIAGAVINVILDPLLIFGIGFFPRMEVTGAAIATVIGQLVASLLAIHFNFKYNHEVKISKEAFKPEKDTIVQILQIGLPTALMQALGSVMTYGFNKIIAISFEKTIAEAGAAVFNAFFKLESIIFMPAIGLNNGMVPIISYNYGAEKKSRIIKVIKLAGLYQVIIMTIGLLIFEIFPKQLLSIFRISDSTLELGVPALRIIAFSFIVIAFNITFVSALQALGHGLAGMLISFLRQIIVTLPAAYLLSLTGNMNLIWFAFPIAEALVLFPSILLFKKSYKNEIKALPDDVGAVAG